MSTLAKIEYLTTLVEILSKVEVAIERNLNILSDTGWIVSIANVAIAFDIKNGVASNAHPSSYELASKFSREDATALAKLCKNGLGDVGVDVSYVQFLQARALVIKGTIAFLTTAGV